MAFQSGPNGQPPRPRRRRRWLWIVGGVFGVFLLIGIVGAIAGGGKDDEGADAKGTPAKVVESSAKAGAPSKSAPAEKPKPSPKIVLSESGNGIKSTAKFHVDGDWDLRYSYDCSAFGAQGNFIVQEGGDALGAIYLNELGAGKSDVTHLHDGGTRFLEVNSTCSWKISVVDVP